MKHMFANSSRREYSSPLENSLAIFDNTSARTSGFLLANDASK
jgi:hypothetical protein